MFSPQEFQMGFLWKENISILSDFLSREKLTHKKNDEFLNAKIYSSTKENNLAI